MLRPTSGHTPIQLLLFILLSFAACKTTVVHATCAAPQSGELTCGINGCSKFDLDCEEYTRMPYPTAAGQTSLLPGATPTYAASTFAKWDELYPPAEYPVFPSVKKPSPYAFNTVSFVKIEPTELHMPVKYRATQDGKEMTTRGTMEFVTTFKLDGSVAVAQSAGVAVTMTIPDMATSVNSLSENENTGVPKRKFQLLTSVSGKPQYIEVKPNFGDDVTANIWKEARRSYNPGTSAEGQNDVMKNDLIVGTQTIPKAKVRLSHYSFVPAFFSVLLFLNFPESSDKSPLLLSPVVSILSLSLTFAPPPLRRVIFPFIRLSA